MSFSKGKQAPVQTQATESKKGTRPYGNMSRIIAAEVEGAKPTYQQLAAVFDNRDDETGEIKSLTVSSREGFTVKPGEKVRIYFNKQSAE